MEIWKDIQAYRTENDHQIEVEHIRNAERKTEEYADYSAPRYAVNVSHSQQGVYGGVEMSATAELAPTQLSMQRFEERWAV
jgi:hypothetical protein